MEDFLTPEDKAALIAFAQPIFAEAKFIDANSVDKDGYRTSGQAQEIQWALERDFQQKSLPKPVVHQQLPPTYTYPEIPQTIQPQYIHATQQNVDDGQLEFKFDQSEQQKTNALLEEISRKLTKILAMLEQSQQKLKNDTTSENSKRPVQEIPRLTRNDK